MVWAHRKSLQLFKITIQGAHATECDSKEHDRNSQADAFGD